MTSSKPTRIVIVGGGFAGAYCAAQLEKRAQRHNLEVVLIDQRNYFIFTPLLVEAGTGALEPRHAVVSLRSFLRRTRIVNGRVTAIDPGKQEIAFTVVGTTSTKRLRYDHVVLSVGSVTKMPDIPGLRENAFELKSIGDSVALRDRAIQMLEIASMVEDENTRRELLTFVFVGGSYTGVEAAGEFQSFLTEATRLYPRVSESDIRIVLVEHNSRILPTLDERLAAYACRELQRRGVDVRLENSVNRIGECEAELRSGDVLPARTVVWCAGISPSPLLEKLPFERDERGWLLGEADMRLKGHDNAWGVGDCTRNPAPDGGVYPPTAQHATRMGTQVARNIVRVMEGKPTEPCRIRSQGMLAVLGSYNAVALVYGIPLRGFVAWWLWRTVYLLKMPTFSRKLRLVLDWTLELFFRREVVQLGVHKTLPMMEEAEELPETSERTPGTASSEREVVQTAP